MLPYLASTQPGHHHCNTETEQKFSLENSKVKVFTKSLLKQK